MPRNTPDQIVVVHISDPHFGEVLLNPKTRILSGFGCHHVTLCKALYGALQEVRATTGLGDEEPFHLVMSGDLTSAGVPSEFFVGHAYFQSRNPDEYETFPPIQMTGLGLPLSVISMVPGNHDHWYGRWVWPFHRGYSPQLFPDWFCPTPWMRSIVSTHGGIQLDIVGIDSSSGLKTAPFNLNPFAGGALSREEIDGQFDNAGNRVRDGLTHKLDLSLQASPADDRVQKRTRAIICHHALTRDGVAQPLDPHSALELVKLASAKSVAAILTGHTHKADQFPYGPSKQPDLPNQVWEIRSPRTLMGPAKREKRGLAPGFWVHQIRVSGDDANLNWFARLFLLHKGRFAWSQGGAGFAFPI